MSKQSEYKALSPEINTYAQDIIDFGNKVRQHREMQGLSLDNLADLIGSDKAAVSKLENGDRIPKYDTVLKIADALNTTPGTFSPARYTDEGAAPAIPQIYERLMKLPEEKREKAVYYINALLDGLLFHEDIIGY